MWNLLSCKNQFSFSTVKVSVSPMTGFLLLGVTHHQKCDLVTTRTSHHSVSVSLSLSLSAQFFRSLDVYTAVLYSSLLIITFLVTLSCFCQLVLSLLTVPFVFILDEDFGWVCSFKSTNPNAKHSELLCKPFTSFLQQFFWDPSTTQL